MVRVRIFGDKEVREVSIEEASKLLEDYSWPGNVREFSNTLQKILIFNRGAPIGPEEISNAISTVENAPYDSTMYSDRTISDWIKKQLMNPSTDNVFDSCMDHFGELLVKEALNLTNGNRSNAAKMLGISRPTLHSKIEKYGLKIRATVGEE